MEFDRKFGIVYAPRVALSEIYDVLKSGDILLFVSATHMPTNSGFTQTFFSHTALIVHDDELLASESQGGVELMPGPVYMKSGASLTPLLTRLKYYTGKTYLLRLSHSLDTQREQQLCIVAKNIVGYPYPSSCQIVAGAIGIGVNARHCFQHVAYLLKAIDLLPCNADISNFLQICRDVCALDEAQLPDNYYYDSPVEVLYDIDYTPVTFST